MHLLYHAYTKSVKLRWLVVGYVVPLNSPIATDVPFSFLGQKHYSSEMASYSSAIRKIIFLLLLIVQDRVASTSLGGDITADTNLTLNGSPYLVSQDLIVAENATLTVQPGVQLHFAAGVALRVKGSLQAKGNPRERIVFTKSPVKNTYNDGIRLTDGNSSEEGRLEIFLSGQWMPVCDNPWDMRNAEVTKCKPTISFLFHSIE